MGVCGEELVGIPAPTSDGIGKPSYHQWLFGAWEQLSIGNGKGGML